VPEFEAGFLERGYRGVYLNLVIIADRLQEFRVQIDYRETCKPEAAAQFGLVEACGLLKQDDATPVEIFDEPGMKDDASRIAVTPFHGEISATYLEVASNEFRHCI
jgi:hypothetical protein